MNMIDLFIVKKKVFNQSFHKKNMVQLKKRIGDKYN